MFLWWMIIILLLTSSTIIPTVHAQATTSTSRNTTVATAPILEDNVRIRNNLPGRDNVRISFRDSYSDGDSCYCSISTLDHGIGNEVVNTPLGILTIRQVCQILGDGPRGPIGRPLYNDIQCGNGPSNHAIGNDEVDCPGRVEYGTRGCPYIGPKWNFTSFLLTTERPTRSPTIVVGVDIPNNQPSATTNQPTKRPVSNNKVPLNTVPTKAPVRTKAPATTFAPSNAPTRTPTSPDTDRRPTRVPIRRRTLPQAKITNLTLCDTTYNPARKIQDLNPLGRMTLLDLAVVGTNLTVVADFESEIDAVYMIFTVDNTFRKTETIPPFTLNGNNGTKFKEYIPLSRVGKHTIVASLYTKVTDRLLDTQTVEVTVIDTGNPRPGPMDQFYLIDAWKQATQPVPSRFIDVDEFGTSLSLGVETNDDDAVASVIFWWDEHFVRREWNEPWTLGGNDKIFYHPSPLMNVPGNYVITAVALDSYETVLGYMQVRIAVVSGDTTTKRPIRAPVRAPTRRTQIPSFQTLDPTNERTISEEPSYTVIPTLPSPIISPSRIDPTLMPSDFMTPVVFETDEPSSSPDNVPSQYPVSPEPTVLPTMTPTINTPTSHPSPDTTLTPSDVFETERPTTVVSLDPSSTESFEPTTIPTLYPTMEPTDDPTAQPTIEPTFIPTENPTEEPTSEPTVPETDEPTGAPISPEPTSESTAFKTDEPLPVPTRSPTTKLPIVAPVAIPAPVMTPSAPTVGSAVILGELRKWHKITLAFTGPFASETDSTINPFMDYRLDVTIKHRSTARQFLVPGYFAADGNAAESSSSSGNQWHCHFSPDAIGIWDYEVLFEIGQNAAVNRGGIPARILNGETGSFSILASNKFGRDHRSKGRLQYVGQHHLRFAETGEWFLKAGADR